MAASSSTKPLNPLRLDVAALVDRSEKAQGSAPLQQLLRLAEPGEPVPDAAASLQWQAHAERRPVRGGAPELWLHLKLDAVVHRTCQRCLQPVAIPLALQRDFLFAATEAQAEAWDAERDDADVLVLTKSLSLLELAEDELLLALPLVPRHDTCPQPLMAPGSGAQAAPEPSTEATKGDNPFAVLAQLKRPH